MTESKLRALIDEAVELDREVTEKSERLKTLKATLVAEAKTRDDERVAVDGAGSKWTKAGANGCLCRVTFPGAHLKSSIDPESRPGQKIITLAGTLKDRLFRATVVYRPVVTFRAQARELMGGKAEKLIRACETESTPHVEFETKVERD